MGGGRLRRPPPIKYQLYIQKNKKHAKTQPKSNDSLHLLRFGRLKTDLKTWNNL